MKTSKALYKSIKFMIYLFALFNQCFLTVLVYASYRTNGKVTVDATHYGEQGIEIILVPTISVLMFIVFGRELYKILRNKED